MTFTDEYDEMPHGVLLGVKVLVVNQKNEILFLKRSNSGTRAGGWDFCGGMVELGEDPEHAAVREAEEESGLSVHDLTILGTYSFARDLIKGKTKHTVIIGYKALAGADMVQLSDEHTEYKWLSKDNVAQLDLPEPHRHFLSLVL